MSVCIFFVLIFASLIFIRPAYARLLARVESYSDGVKKMIEDRTSLSISYKSLSPSVLSAFYIRGIELRNSENIVVVSVDKLRLDYRLFRLIRGDFDKGFDTLVVDGVKIDAARIFALMNPSGNQNSGNSFTPADFKARLPFSLTVKNVSFEYEEGPFSAGILVKKLSASYSEKNDQLDVALSSSVRTGFGKARYTCSLDAGGNIKNGFENSELSVTASNLSDGSFRLNKLNFLFSFADGFLSVSTIRNTIPLEIKGSLSVEKLLAHGEIRSGDLQLGSLFQTAGKNAFIKKAWKTEITTETVFDGNLSSKKIAYSTKTNVLVPDALIPSGGILNVELSGNEKGVSVNDFSVRGPQCDVSSELYADYRNMSLSGNLDLTEIILGNGTVISCEVYLDPLKKGFMAFVPQVFMGEKSFTALQLSVIPNTDSFDFSFEGYDYSHPEADDTARVQIDGSYLLSSKYLQTSLSANSFFLDSVIQTASLFVKEDAGSVLSKSASSVSDFMFSGDAYFSTDFSSVSYNIPYILLANTKKDNQALMLSFDGNEQSVSLTQMDMIFGKQVLHGSASLDRLPDSSDMFFVSDLNFNSIPYHFSGTFADRVFSLSGDYESEFNIDFRKKGRVEGYALTDNFPIPVLGTSIVSTLNAEFDYSDENGININLYELECEDAGNKFVSRPHVSLGGNITQYGARFDTVTYGDIYSQLDGSADVAFNMFDDIFGSATIQMNMKNPLSEESISVQATASNPDGVKFSSNALKNDYYFDSSILVNHLDLNRFTYFNSDNNELSASMFITGTIEHPYVSLGVENASVMISGNAMRINGSVMLEDSEITVNELNLNLKDTSVNNVSGSFSLDSFTGNLKANIDAIVMEQDVHVPLVVEVSDSVKKEGSLLPAEMNVSVQSDGIYGSLMKKNVAFSLGAIFSEDGVSVVSSENLGLFGFYQRNGDLRFELTNKEYASMVFSGNIEPVTGKMNCKASDVNVKLKNIFSYLNWDKFINVYSGDLKGSVTLRGSLSDPEFVGAMSLENPALNLPTVVPDRMFTDKLLLTFFNGEIDIVRKKVFVKKNSEVYGSCKIFFDKWKFDHLEALIETDRGRFVPVAISNGVKNFSISGEADLKLNLYLAHGDLDITGNIMAEKAEVYINLAKLMAESSSADKKRACYVNCDLSLLLGTHVRLNADPLIRCVFVPNTNARIQFEQRTMDFVADGTLNIKTGDVSYLNRNFYIKEGTVKFVSNEDALNPKITVRAETRERDDSGNNVTIVLSAENQYLRDFTPKFSSVPAKSEAEIQTLLGQIVVADSETVGNFLFAAGDYALQSLVGRKLENKLRDFLNFDIFSVRTNIIQNTFGFSLAQNKTNEQIGLGNFLDNSTVYIGKYLGSALYVDAMVDLQYDKRWMGNPMTLNGLKFQPEIGMELESPFVNIRWSIAPDIDAMFEGQYKPSSSVTLSWKFSF